MATGSYGLLTDQGPRLPQAQANTPFRGNLMTSFQAAAPTSTSGGAHGIYNYNQGAGSNSTDSDVRGAQAAYNQMMNPDQGTSHDEQNALYNMYLGRINQKNSLAESINSNEDQRKSSVSNIYGEATRSLNQGLKNTRENFNSRGLLYSGVREGGEQAVRGGTGAKLASDVSGTNRDYANAKTSAEQAYTNVGLAGAQQNIQLANEAFNTVNQNNIARMQAYQTLAQGIGGGAAAGYNAYANKPQTPPPTLDTGTGMASTGGYNSSPDNSYGFSSRNSSGLLNSRNY